jgi:hypothetical protein
VDIGWAIKAMKNGERVRRAGWPQLTDFCEEIDLATWIYLYYEDRDGWMPSIMAMRSDGKISPFVMLDPYLLADDWELA